MLNISETVRIVQFQDYFGLDNRGEPRRRVASSEGARIEAPKASSGVRCGEGCPGRKRIFAIRYLTKLAALQCSSNTRYYLLPYRDHTTDDRKELKMEVTTMISS